MNTTEELRGRLSAELAELGALSDLVPGALQRGAAIRRRRRLGAGVAIGLTAAAAAVILPGALGTSARQTAVDTPIASARPATSSLPRTVTDEEYGTAIEDTLSALLPARFGAVTVRWVNGDEGDTRYPAIESTGEVALGMTFRVDGVAPDTGPPYCGTDGCRQLDDGWSVGVERLTDDTGAHESALYLTNEGLSAQLYLFGKDRAVPLSDKVLLDLAQEPVYRDLVKLGVDYAASRPPTGFTSTGTPGTAENPRPAGSETPMPPPVWPAG
ncbi:MAG: hypothetical protein ACRCYU_23785 [Nocardioides sp.]